MSTVVDWNVTMFDSRLAKLLCSSQECFYIMFWKWYLQFSFIFCALKNYSVFKLLKKFKKSFIDTVGVRLVKQGRQGPKSLGSKVNIAK